MTPKENVDDILLLRNIHLAASELTRHLFLHGEIHPALCTATWIFSTTPDCRPDTPDSIGTGACRD